MNYPASLHSGAGVLSTGDPGSLGSLLRAPRLLGAVTVTTSVGFRLCVCRRFSTISAVL